MVTSAPAVGRFGIWSRGLREDDPALRQGIGEAAAELEELGVGAIWLGGSPGVGHAARIVEATSAITVATGILSIWDHQPDAVRAEYARLEAAHPGRFLLGLGASHAQLAKGYERPYSSMARYLDGLDGPGADAVPAERRVLAALGPKMLGLARDRTAGAHPYLVTAEHTAQARDVLGPEPLLAPELKVVLEAEPGRARTLARQALAVYLGLPNYTGNILRLGFTEQDLAEGGSDRLVDALFAWGDDARVRSRIDEYLAAGADHVALQVVTADGPAALPREQWRRLAALVAG